MGSATAEKGQTGRTVLVIEDDTFTRLSLCRILRKMNYEVLEAADGHKGLAAFAARRPAAVITDLLMPDKEGLETISEIRALDPAVRIIAMTGGGLSRNMNFLELARQSGADETVGKPFAPADILRLLETA